MEEFSFDIGGLLSEEEANRLFEETNSEEKASGENEQKVNDAEEQVQEDHASEKVGEEESEEIAITQTGDGSSPNVYSSIANALKNDGIFPDFEDKEISAVKTPEDFAELFEKAITARLDERTRRVDSALGNGARPDDVKMYEQTLAYLDSVTDEAIESETENGENLRKQLIYNDLLNRGYSHEKAVREVDKSFKSGSDIEDAKDALAALNKFYRGGYENLQKATKDRADAARKAQQKQADDFRKMILEDDLKFGESKLDKRTCQKVFDAVSKPVYKDPDTGQLLTEIQKFQRENPMEFLKQLGMWYVLTDGGKNTDSLVKGQVRAERNKGIRELERKINTSAFDSDGSLKYMSGEQIGNDSLLSDGWQIDMNS